MKIIMLVGLPGSGKTHYGESLGLPFYDDLTQTGGLKAIEPADAIIISDFSLIFKKQRRVAEKVLKTKFPNAKIEYVVWENNPEACWKNIVRRKDTKNIAREFLHFASRHYTSPKKMKELLPVYEG